MYSFGALLLHLISSFSHLNALEMPLDLVHETVKPSDYSRHLLFPSHSDGVVEVPPTVEDEYGFVHRGSSAEEKEYSEDEPSAKGVKPSWIEVHMAQHEPKQKHPKHNHAHRQIHAHGTVPSIRRCSIEISSKIPGICQSMAYVNGNVCVSGDYIDAFNAECM
ncbi:uncharacterized protein LOC133331882 [Musca vetustissima]|uniref:uncharacterized protein LOC133331882 n=1 Tax=Musca vetustissima TaxID=27455 RepID=UPI002AB7D058|nr:uncharacterized protein LOC133331882 [Musca vetustissima]